MKTPFIVLASAVMTWSYGRGRCGCATAPRPSPGRPRGGCCCCSCATPAKANTNTRTNSASVLANSFMFTNLDSHSDLVASESQHDLRNGVACRATLNSDVPVQLSVSARGRSWRVLLKKHFARMLFLE